MAAKLLCLICKGLYWFNPFIYPLNRLLNQTAELACDEWVAQQLDVDSKSLYAQLIISISSSKTVPYKYCALFTGNYEFVQKRIDCIMKKPPKNKMRHLLSMIISMIAIVLSSIPAFAGPPLQLLHINSAPPEAISYKSGYDYSFYMGNADIEQEQGFTTVYDRQFTTIDGKIYDAADSFSDPCLNCDHIFIDGDYSYHKRNGDRECTTKFYASQRCSLCSYLIVGELNQTAEYLSCPH